MTLRTVTIVIMGAATVGLIGWDVYAALAHQHATISEIVQDAAFARPMLPCAVGILIGHFFWPIDRSTP